MRPSRHNFHNARAKVFFASLPRAKGPSPENALGQSPVRDDRRQRPDSISTNKATWHALSTLS